MNVENVQVRTLCKIRDLYRSISEFETEFQDQYDICLNEGMLLCTLGENKFSSSELAERLGLTNSNASKVIRSLEKKGYIERIIGQQDKRQMYFTLTKEGDDLLNTIKCSKIDLPELLKSIVGE
ncbi:MAG: MarR family transcriptional regulator [Bacteroidales bacterium]|nr:MarR family transcriptional regulator [Bacteroidales bacterium]